MNRVSLKSRIHVGLLGCKMPFCPSCGKEFSEGDKFCLQCGESLPTSATEPQSPDTTVTPQKPATVKRSIIGVLMVACLLAGVVGGYGAAYTCTVSGQQAQIAALQSQISTLQTQYNALQATYAATQSSLTASQALSIGTTLETYYQYVRLNCYTVSGQPFDEARWSNFPNYYSISVTFAADLASHVVGYVFHA